MEGEKRETQSPAVPVLTLEAEGRDSADGTRDAEALQGRIRLGEVDVYGGACTAYPRPPASLPCALLSPSQSPPTPHSLCSCVPSIDPAAGSGATPAPGTAPGTAGFTKLGSITGAAANHPAAGQEIGRKT